MAASPTRSIPSRPVPGKVCAEHSAAKGKAQAAGGTARAQQRNCPKYLPVRSPQGEESGSARSGCSGAHGTGSVAPGKHWHPKDARRERSPLANTNREGQSCCQSQICLQLWGQSKPNLNLYPEKSSSFAGSSLQTGKDPLVRRGGGERGSTWGAAQGSLGRRGVRRVGGGCCDVLGRR